MIFLRVSFKKKEFTIPMECKPKHYVNFPIFESSYCFRKRHTNKRNHKTSISIEHMFNLCAPRHKKKTVLHDKCRVVPTCVMTPRFGFC